MADEPKVTLLEGVRITVTSYFINEEGDTREVTAIYVVPLACMGLPGDTIRQQHLSAQLMAGDILGPTCRPMTQGEIDQYTSVEEETLEPSGKEPN